MTTETAKRKITYVDVPSIVIVPATLVIVGLIVWLALDLHKLITGACHG